MFRTFNMGIGLAIIVAAKDIAAVRTFLRRQKTGHYLIGEVINDKKNKVILTSTLSDMFSNVASSIIFKVSNIRKLNRQSTSD